MKWILTEALVLAVAAPLFADGTAAAISPSVFTTLDTRAGMRAVTAIDGLTGLTYRAGETITATAPNGTSATRHR